MSFQKILVALDELEHSKTVFCKALHLAKSDRAKLVILTCATSKLEPPGLGATAESQFYPNLFSATAPALLPTGNDEVARIKALLKPYCEAAGQHGVAVELIVKVGAPETQICAVAQDWGADLIIMGRRGLKGLSEALLGSVSNYVLHHADCSVLVVQGDR